ncbi:energy transducer TonB [Hyphococcus sp.]|uniref:energy transducer TonB n=1 Tax=Hyphococcus sp. TaxID=2038636 RepID=UPI00208A5EE8|nr:MAG: hypothetical protein DHS20C04_25650 [Marinicaulis sp.]
MRNFLLFIGALAALTTGAYAQREETPAIPSFQPTPNYPVACQQALGPDAPPQFVSVMFRINRNGESEDVRVRETSHECFNDAVIAAVRKWKYEPRRIGNLRVSQDDVEVTFTFVLEEPTKAEGFDARPIKRVPPRYPLTCMNRADDEENVLVEFDVTASGQTENINVLDSTNHCLDKSAKAAVLRWEYNPKTLDGVPVARKNVQTLIRYLLSDGRNSQFRLTVRNRLLRAENLAIKKKDPAAAFIVLEELEEKYGESFSDVELAAFHQVRGVTRLQAGDYVGALDDFRIVKQLGGSSEEGANLIDETIKKLEAALGVEPDAPVAAEPPERSGEVAGENQ